MSYSTWVVGFFFTSTGFERGRQADFIEKCKEVIVEGKGVTKRVTEGREKMVF